MFQRKFLNQLLVEKSRNMYVILVYDIGEKRVGKVLKLCRRYLNWIQNSVFEGDITEVKLKELKAGCEKIMEEEDNMIIFKGKDRRWMEKEVVGRERSSADVFL